MIITPSQSINQFSTSTITNKIPKKLSKLPNQSSQEKPSKPKSFKLK